jgi:hypothetical protein
MVSARATLLRAMARRAAAQQDRAAHVQPREEAMQAIAMRHDTRAWKAQVWISVMVAALLCAIGLAWLPGREIDRAFMVMGYVFCTTAAFALAKFVRDNAIAIATAANRSLCAACERG